jgi:hypothetical protein
MADLIRVVYHSLRESREAGYVFYPGYVKGDIDQSTGQPKPGTEDQALFNPGVFNLVPGDNYFTEDQIKVVLATTGMQEKVDNKIIELDAQFDMLGAKPQVKTDKQLSQEAQSTIEESEEETEDSTEMQT